MLNGPEFQVKVNFVFPYSLREIERKYSTKISISKVHQYGIINGYGDREDWDISVYVITDICVQCGETRSPIGNIPQNERCSRHRWDRAIAIALFHAVGDTFEAAMQQADEKAQKFNEAPEKWVWKRELFLSRQEYLEYTELNRLKTEIERLRTENTKLKSKIQQAELRT